MSQKKTLTLDMLRAASSRDRQPDPSELPVLRLAALLNTFTLERIEGLLRSEWQQPLPAEDREQLLANSSLLDEETTYSLSDRIRSRVLATTLQNGWLPQWLRGRELPAADATERFLWSYLDEQRPRPAPLPEQSMEELVGNHRAAMWLEALDSTVSKKIGPERPEAVEIYAYIKREELLTPFRSITRHFQGRERELAQLKEYVWGTADPAAGFLRSLRPPLLISGIGGVGKSTLIARYLLDEARADRERRIPFVYLDFDKSGFSISEPLSLAFEALRQLVLQFPTRTLGEGERAVRVAEIMQDIRQDIRTTLREDGGRLTRGGSDKASFSAQSQRSTVSIRGNLYESISRQYLQRFEKELRNFSVPLLVVLDSFEEAQYRASSTEILNLFRFIDEVAEFFPQLRLFIVGRNDLDYLGPLITHLELPPFDEPAALAYLQANGITDPAFARELFQEVGGNPLTLKLAVRYIRTEWERHPDRQRSVYQLLDGIDTHRVQEQLVRRNLKHIKDPQVQRLAFPGMLVRRISPEIIRHVLAEPCGLGKIGPEVAEHIFENLRREQFLLDEENGQLVFRRDLRVTLYDLVVKEYGDTAREIHARALDFYRDRPDAASRAEYLYHWLKTGGDLDAIATVQLTELRPYIENFLPELPLNAYIFLAAQLGIRVRPDFIQRARLREWEDYLVAETEDALQHGEETDLGRLAARWGERSERTGRPEIRYAEAKLAARSTLEKTDPKAILRFQTDWHLGIHTLHCRQLEYQRKFEQCFAALEEVSNAQFATAAGRDQLHYLLALFRVAGRIGRDQNYLLDRFRARYEHSQIDTQTLKDYLSPYYVSLPPLLGRGGRSLLEKGNEGELLEVLVREIRPAILSEDEYIRLYTEITALPEPLSTLDQQLSTRVQQTVFSLTETGTPLVAISEVLYYLELRYAGDMQRIREEILGLRRTETTSTQTEVSSLVERARELIGAARPEQVIDLLQDNRHLLGDYEKELYLLASRYKRMQQEERMGTVSRDESSREFNRINYTLLEILDQIEKR